MALVKYFENAAVSVPVELILFRLGYKKGITEMDGVQKDKIVDGIEKGRSLCSVKAAYGTYKITANDGGEITLENGIVFKTKQVEVQCTYRAGVLQCSPELDYRSTNDPSR